MLVREAFRVAEESVRAPCTWSFQGHCRRALRRRCAGGASPSSCPWRERRRSIRAARQSRAEQRSPCWAQLRRGRSTSDIAQFVLRTRPYFTHTDGQSTVPGGTELYGVPPRSRATTSTRPSGRADLIITIGHDTVEKPPFIMGPRTRVVRRVSTCDRRAGLFPAIRGDRRHRALAAPAR